MLNRILLVALCGVACAHPAARALPPTSGQPGVAELPPALARARAASGGAGWDAVTVIETHGAMSFGGLAGAFTSWEDVRDGRSRTQFSVGPVSGGEGFDGQARWSRDPGGEVSIEDAAESIALGRTMTWLTQRGYLRPGGARYRELGERTEGARRYVVLEAVPERAAPLELWMDAGTGLLARVVYHQGLDTVITTYDDYREVAGGVRLPFRAVIDSGDPRNLVTLEVSSVSTPAAVAADLFARPATSSESVSFSGPTRATELPFELINNHIYLEVRINEQPARVLVDTGGLNVLTTAGVARLGLVTEGKLAGRGAGAQQVDVGVARGATLAIGTIALRDPVFYVFELGELAKVEDVEADGIVGFELFHRFVVRIDYAARRIRLSAPETFTPPSRAIPVPFVLHGRMPMVQGEIDGTPARFTVDTGARNSLTANAPFVKRRELVARYRPRFEAINGWGVGGALRTSPVRFHEVKVGAAVVREVAGELFTGDQGAFADPTADGNLGGGILHRFTVTFDYGKRVMYLEPNASLGEPDRYDRAGMFLIRAGAGIELVSVTPAGAAARAGLQVGDRIVSVDGTPAEQLRLGALRRRFLDEPVGTRLALVVERQGQRREVELRLAELLP